MRNPKIIVLGASGSGLAQIKILLASKNIDLVDVGEESDATVDADWVIDAIKAPDIKYNMVDDVPDIDSCCNQNTHYKEEQSWRGGSRGKGGKIKYARR